MAQISGESLLEQLNWRYAVKKFDVTRKISAADWQALEKSLILTPSSFGLQPWYFIVIRNDKLREQLRAVSWSQSQVTDCSHYVIFARKDNLGKPEINSFLDDLCQTRGLTRANLAGYERVMVDNLVNGPRAKIINEWAAHQVYIALGNFMTSAAVMGIDTCPMEGLDPDQYDQLLGLKARGYSTLVACAAGYRAADDAYAAVKKVRFPKSQMIETID